MDTICQEIGIHPQHICETSVPGRYQLICDKKWLQTIEQNRKLDKFPTYPQLDRRAHPTGVLDHPWTRILVQTYKKQPQHKVFPLPQNASSPATSEDIGPQNPRTDLCATPLTYTQAVSYVTTTNFKNLWETAYKRYAAAHTKFCQTPTGHMAKSGGGMANSILLPNCSLMPYDAVLKELIQRIFNCPVIHCNTDRLQGHTEEGGDGQTENDEGAQTIRDPYKDNDCHANVLPAIVAIESSTHISVLFYPPPVITSLHDCITYSPAVLSKSYNKCLFLIYQLLQLSRSLQSIGLFMGDVRLHDVYMRDNLWIQVVPHLESNILQTRQPGNLDVVAPLQPHATTPSEPPIIVTDPQNIETPEDEYVFDVNVNDDADDDDEALAGRAKFDLKFAYDLQQFTLREYCEMWCNGQMSNFDYLTILNNATGRTTTNPSYHHIMPWVTDFTGRNGANWRDLSKSKYRLNKGDVHLDLMFSNASQQLGSHMGGMGASSSMHMGSASVPVVGVGGHSGVSSNLPIQNIPHHVSDFLSEITYFVYTARRTPQHILCEHVRKVWVPAEYPVSIQRLQQWTPDECIPEFYTDPMIFKSIHEDLPDLELPAWATCPEDFICKHREALESQYVSERLHHWIDLNFGYKLSGKAAIKSKNVCLSVVDQHKNLCQRGVVQLFTLPHPPKRFPSPWFKKQAPRLSQVYNLTRDFSISPSNHRSHNDIKRIAKSTENLTQNPDLANPIPQQDTLTTPTHSSGLRSSPRSTSSSFKQRPLPDTSTSPAPTFYPLTNSCIELPKDYNPCQLLHSLETMQTFYARTFPKQSANGNAHEKIQSGDLLFDGDSDEHSFTNELFAFDTCNTTTDTTPSTTGSSQKAGRRRNLLAPNVYHMKRRTLKMLLTEYNARELQAMGCFIVELFSSHRLRPLLMTGVSAKFAERLQACRTVAEVHRQDLPKCVRYIVRELLMPAEARKATTERGLPPPTAAQLLEPIFYNLLIPFPNTFYPTYALIRALHAFDFASTLLELNTHFNCNGQECGRYTEIDRQRVLFERKIAECKVMSCCAHMGHLLEPIGYEQFPAIELLLPHIIDLLSNEQTSILTAWNLFDPVAQALGVSQTQKYLLGPLMKLYDVESFERGMISVRSRSSDASASGGSLGGQVRFSTSSSFKSRKSVKLYHHSFLLRLIVRFGLRCFLHNFIAPLIEAVGGYKEPEDGNGLHYHSVAHDSARRLSKNVAYADDDPSSITLIEPQMAEPEQGSSTLPKQEIEEVFSFDDDVNSDHISSTGTYENKSVDSFDMRTATAEEAQEDFNQSQTTPEKLAISELIYGSKISNTSFDDMDKMSAGSRDSPTATTSAASQLGPKSPTIDIPAAAFRRSYQLNTIDCEIGSRKSVDSFDIITQSAEDEEQRKANQVQETTGANAEEVSSDSLQASVISKISEAKALQNNRISEMSAESLVWLSHRLGPVLTSRFITKNLLKMLTLCYVGQENLLPETAGAATAEANILNYFSVADARVVGDRSAARVLECLMSIAGLFGEEVILLQYFPHISELIALSNRRITGSLEGAIISSLQLVKYIVPCLKDVTIMEHLTDTFLNALILPIVELLGSTRQLMPSGYLGRSVLARKLLDAIYVLCVRIGPDMSKEHLTVPALRPFFLIFDKAFGISNNFAGDSMRPISPPLRAGNNSATPQQERVHEEIRDVFDPALAHISYLAFLRFLGDAIMQRTLVNLEFILTLCHEFEQPAHKALYNVIDPRECEGNDAVDCPTGATSDFLSAEQNQVAANSFGTHVIGNRLEVANATTPPTAAGSSAMVQPPCRPDDINAMEVLDMVAYKFDQVPTSRNLKGNWLAYWSHEISRPDKETTLNFKQIKLQSFVGHTNSIRALVALDNENSFISASKDKTVKLWSLRSEGDGRKSSPCQFTYTAHKKSIHSLAFLEAMRIVVSCDSGVHFWDPFIGRTRGVLDAPRHNPVTVVKSLPSPSPLIVAGTSEATVKIIDCRCMQYVNEWRVNAPYQSAATVRCLTIAPSGNWLAVGLSSGSIVMLDTRTGVLLNTWRPMECDLLQLAAPNDHVLVSSALDHSLAVWHANDGILHYQMRPPPEPAHFLQTIDSELVYATSGNRIGVYSDLSSSHAAHSITKLRSENFRGVLTSLAVLPLNRAFLAGNESGNIVMLC